MAYKGRFHTLGEPLRRTQSRFLNIINNFDTRQPLILITALVMCGENNTSEN
jgi:hypothetical protein